MSAQPLDELFAGHGGPWTEAEWLALPESMGTVELLEYAEPTRAAPAGLLVLNQPFEVTLNLPALARDPLAPEHSAPPSAHRPIRENR